MATVLDHDQSGARNSLLVQRTAIERHNGVLTAPDHQSGRFYLGHEHRHLGVVHVRLPGEQRRHLTVPGGYLALFGRRLTAVQPCVLRCLRRVIELLLQHFFGREQKDIGHLPHRGLHTSRTYQHHAAYRGRRHGGHFCCQPAAHGETNDGKRGELEFVHKPAIKIGQIMHPLHPVRPV